MVPLGPAPEPVPTQAPAPVFAAVAEPDPFATQTAPLPGSGRNLPPGRKLFLAFLVLVAALAASAVVLSAAFVPLVLFTDLEPGVVGEFWSLTLSALVLDISLCLSFRILTGLRLNYLMGFLIPLLGGLGMHFAQTPLLALAIGLLNGLVLCAWMASQIRIRPRSGIRLSEGSPGGLLLREYAPDARVTSAQVAGRQASAPRAHSPSDAPPPFLG